MEKPRTRKKPFLSIRSILTECSTRDLGLYSFMVECLTGGWPCFSLGAAPADNRLVPDSRAVCPMSEGTDSLHPSKECDGEG